MAIVFHVLGWAIFGLIVGALARLVVPGKQNMSWLMTALLGVAGSLLGGAISWLVFGSPERNYNPGGWIMSLLGAILVVAIYSRVVARVAR